MLAAAPATHYRLSRFWWCKTFYLTSAAPRLRTDENGDPIFLMVQYALSDEEREADPTLPGGGYLNFDAVFSPTEDEEAAADVHRQELLVDGQLAEVVIFQLKIQLVVARVGKELELVYRAENNLQINKTVSIGFDEVDII